VQAPLTAEAQNAQDELGGHVVQVVLDQRTHNSRLPHAMSNRWGDNFDDDNWDESTPSLSTGSATTLPMTDEEKQEAEDKNNPIGFG
jgi:hypothetical protein